MADRRSGWLARLALVSVLVPLTAGCSRPAPSAPDSLDGRQGTSPAPAAAPASAAATGDARQALSFDLVNGTFTLTTPENDSLTGTYTGESVVGKHGESATLDLQVTGGSGVFEGATGTLSGAGDGAFTGEGDFQLWLKGTVTVGPRTTVQVRVSLGGTSALSCDGGQSVVSQVAAGTLNRVATVEAELHHAVTNAGCAS